MGVLGKKGPNKAALSDVPGTEELFLIQRLGLAHISRLGPAKPPSSLRLNLSALELTYSLAWLI